MTLASLLHPVATDEFLNHYWTRRALHVPGSATRFRRLFDWGALNDLLNSGALEWPHLRMARRGAVIGQFDLTTSSPGAPPEQLDPAKILRLCREGATLIVDELERHSTPVRDLVDRVADELGEYVQVNLYCSWPGTPGFALHYDTHEAIVLQVEGRKTWRVFAPTYPYPLRFQKPSTDKPSGPPYLQVTLTAGDLLYVPRGHWHDAVADQQASVHLTLGAACATGLNFAAWLTQTLKDDAVWRENLPLVADPSPNGPAGSTMAAHLDALCAELRARLGDSGLARRYLDHVARDRRPRRPFGLPAQVLPDPRIEPETRIERPSGQTVIAGLDRQGRRTLTVWNQEFTWPNRLDGAIAHLFSTHAATGTELLERCPGVRWEELRPMLAALVRAGVLRAPAQVPDAAPPIEDVVGTASMAAARQPARGAR